MKKSFFYFVSFILILLSLCACSKRTSPLDTPEGTVEAFFKGLQHQEYSSTESYYSENMDNMANFRNQVEVISPLVANELFNKMADFSYTIEDVNIDSSNPDKATVAATITAYDLGKSFEKTVLDYIKSDIEMTFDGAKSEDIVKSVEDTLVNEITNTTSKFTTPVQITVIKKEDKWKVDKVSNNPTLLNALSGNIISTIQYLSKVITPNK